MAKLDELLKAFRSREGIKGTTVAKMMTRKEAGNYTTIGSRVSNPFSHPKYNVSSIGRDKHYFLLNQYENDIARDLIKSLTHVIKNNISLSSKQKKNVYDNYDMLITLQRANKKSEDILIKDGKNPLDVIATEKAKIHPNTGKIDTNLTEQPPDLFKDLEDLNKSMKDLDEAGKKLEESGMGLETDLKKLKESTDKLKRLQDDPFDEIGKAERREKHKFMNTGKGFWENEAYNRAVARKLLLHLDKNGIIKLTDKVRDSLKNYDDLRGGGTLIHVPDPIRVLREHIKPAHSSDHDTIFDILPQGLDEFSASKPGVFDELVKRLKTDKKKWRDAEKESDASIAGTYEGPIWKEETKWQIKPKIGEAEEYFNPTEFQNRINYEKEVLNEIKTSESMWGDVNSADTAKRIKDQEKYIKELEEARIRVYPEFKGPFPKVDPANTNFIMHSIDESWGPHGGDINRIGRHKMKTKVDPETGESTSTSWDTFDEKTGKFFEKESDYKFNKAYKNNEEVDIKPVDTKEGIESIKVISEGDEGFDEISEKLGITAKPGFPVTETGKADLKLVKASTKDEKFRAELKAKLINLPEFKKTNMTEADMDFVLKDVRADLGMDESYQTVLKNAKLLDEQKKKKNMDEAWNEATKDFPTSGNVDDIKKWLLKKREEDIKKGIDVSGMDDLLKSDFEKATKVKKRDALNIRIMKNFDQPLDDIVLGKEGYNLQEINVLKNARKRLESGEETHPNEALLREKELLADEAGVDVDELTVEIDWGDMTPDSFATGGRVGYFMGSGSKGELTEILDRLKMVTQGEGMYSNWNHANRKSLQRALTSRANAILGN